MTARIVLVTGTDTGVGKTFVAFGLARRLSEAGRRVIVVKPVESGCGESVTGGEDGAMLARATGQAEPAAALVRLRAPVAPPVAAEREGVELDYGAWCREIRRLAGAADVLVLEGAGGLLSPLTWQKTALNLAEDLGAEAVVVAPDRLGTLNHTLLTLRLLAAAEVPVLGVVLVAPEVADRSTGTNATALRRAGAYARVALLPRLARIDDAAAHTGPIVGWME